MMHGSCLCGGVRFEVVAPFDGVVHCHCAGCKKLAGGAGTTSGRVSTEAIRILEGAELLRTFQPEDGRSKTFCTVCGSNLRAGWPEAEASAVRLAAVDSGLDQLPQAHIFVRSVAPGRRFPRTGSPVSRRGRRRRDDAAIVPSIVVEDAGVPINRLMRCRDRPWRRRDSATISCVVRLPILRPPRSPE
jgi:hypothetical protein